jgi:hypothetical protein
MQEISILAPMNILSEIYYEKLPRKKAKIFKDRLLGILIWTENVWWNKIYGKTKIDPWEQDKIRDLYNDLK